MSKLIWSPRAHVLFSGVALLAGCASGASSGKAYTMSITPVIPTNQSPFDGVDDVLLTVLAEDGTSEQVDLGAPDSGLTLSGTGIGPLANSTLTFSGRTGSTTVSRGRTGPLTIDSGTDSTTVLFGSVDAVGWIGSMLEASVGPIVLPVGDGTFHVFGGVSTASSGTWKKEVTLVQSVSLSAPGEDLVPEEIGELPVWTDLMGADQQGWFGSSVGAITAGEDAGKVFIGGGGAGLGLLDPLSVSAGVWLYDPATVSFEQLSGREELARPRSEAATVVDAQGAIVMWGGWTQDDTQNVVAIDATVEAWDPSTRKSTSADTNFDPQRNGMFDVAGAAIGDAGSLFCGGGLQGTDGQYATWTTSAECHRVSLGHDVSADSDLPVALAGLAMVTLADGRVLATGGSTQETDVVFDFATTADASADGWIYDPETTLWTPEGSMNVARVHHQMVLLPDGRVLIAGGSDEYAPGTIVAAGLSCVEIYDPTDHSYTAVEDCDAGSDADGLAGRAVAPGIAVDPDFGALIAGGSADAETAQDAINVVLLGE